MKGINIGCGQSPTKGWRNFDNSLSLRLSKLTLLSTLLLKIGLLEAAQYEFIQYASNSSIEFGDATKGLPISSGSIDVVYSSHMLEHLDRQEVALFLQEARRVLRRGGIIRLALPDIRIQVQKYIKNNDADAFIEGTLLAQPRPRTVAQRIRMLLVGTRNHQWMYDGDSLSRLLQAHGFISPVVLKAGESLIENQENLNLFERCSESVYVEAVSP